jgi:hypothetical protein
MNGFLPHLKKALKNAAPKDGKNDDFMDLPPFSS